MTATKTKRPLPGWGESFVVKGSLTSLAVCSNQTIFEVERFASHQPCVANGFWVLSKQTDCERPGFKHYLFNC